MKKTWAPIEGTPQEITAVVEDPLRAISKAEIPAIVMRKIYNPDQCRGLIERFLAWGLIREPGVDSDDHRSRIDIGTSLFNRGDNKRAFLHHAAATHELFKYLFSSFDNPVDVVYQALADLAPEKDVKVAEEPDGSRYGPAIFRVHYETHSYKPHFDHVTLREKRTNYVM